MNSQILLLILGMALVTYIPRALPAVLLKKLRFGPKFERFLKLIPYTAMSALVFPGIFSADPRWYVVAAGALTAIVAGYKKLPVAVTVLSSVSVVLLLQLIAN